MKIECQHCGRKVTIGQEERASSAPMRYCRRCGEELPSQDD